MPAPRRVLPTLDVPTLDRTFGVNSEVPDAQEVAAELHRLGADMFQVLLAASDLLGNIDNIVQDEHLSPSGKVDAIRKYMDAIRPTG